MKIRHFVSCAVLLGSALSATAQTSKPGLWEITSKMKSSSGELDRSMAAMQEQMAKMPPEQRKAMEEMMAKQGVSISAGAPGAMTVKMCMTKDMAERNEMPAAGGDCTSTPSPRIGNSMKFAFTCTKPPGSGEGVITFNGSDAYAMKMTINATVKGKPEKMDMEGAGKWLGAECGDVKPMAMPKALPKK